VASPAVAGLAGRVLAGRYRLLGSVGAGASGRVYVADDVRLRRRVAVKVLHGGLADDQGFLRRFRSEARLAASLHHPNIVAVYDWGEDAGLPFLVLELLTGGSLRTLIDRGGRLHPAQAAVVGRQVALALHHAHSRGIVHRDVKSANLLFDEHAIVRVADFGLARALAEASWTEPAGGGVGTLRYAAPEQADGGPVDGRADCYSLAVVLLEAVTGQVPDVGATPVETVLTRARRPLTVPPGLGPLGAVLARAGQPDPSERFPDAGALAEALGAAARTIGPPPPLVLPGLGDPVDDPAPTRIAPAGLPGVAAPTEAVAVAPPEPAPVGPTPGSPGSPGSPRRARPPGSHRRVPVVVALVVLAALVAAGALAVSALGGVGAPVAAPNLVGLGEERAASAVASAGLRLEVTRRRGDDVAGLVVAQRPAAGVFVGEGGVVRIVVSRGPPPVAVPDGLVGLPVAEAQARLEQTGFVVKVERAFDETVPVDRVLGADPAPGTPARPESEVRLRVSDGPAPVPVPAEVTGKTFDEAAAILRARGFAVARADVFDDTAEVGRVVGTTPPVGSPAARGATVTVNVSRGPELVAVPAGLVGMTVEAASQQLQAAGLVPVVENFAPGRRVRATDPAAGTRVRRGARVTLFL
jgi:beta-lactam-binding protein with PASTA domain